ncbi:MAG: mechanosensitive ion channel domain-containing protein [Pseudomonadota bacterium]
MTTLDQMLDVLQEWNQRAPLLAGLVGVFVLILLAITLHQLSRRLLIRGARHLAAQTSSHWDDALVGHRIFRNLSHLVPAFILYFGVDWFDQLPSQAVEIIKNTSVAYARLFSVLTVGALINALSAHYERQPISRERPLKGFFQISKIVIYFLGTVLVLAALVDRSPLLFFSGLGALTAVLLLVFKDTILSLVASVQISTSGILRVGDWVEMPQYGADGDVIDIALHTVRIQNWDKTVTTIPTHRFISDAFKNWRYMSTSGGRRIKRAINIDIGSVRFLHRNEVDDLREFALLRDYIDHKRAELEISNQNLADDGNVNARRLTNLGTFRAYILAYLKHHSEINSNMTLLVRQLDSTATGIPMEIYAFTRSTEWAEHERVKSDVFDHLLAIAPSFDLRIFQSPSGIDISTAALQLSNRQDD